MKSVITEAYRAEQAALHAKGNYGTTGMKYGELISKLLVSTGAASLLDYGCGSQRSLLRTLVKPEDVVYEGYDPAVPAFSAHPLPAELVCCIDVLEHIEPPLLDNVLDDLADLCDPFGFFTVHTGPAMKVLSDGRNAHLTQEGPAWWLPKFQTRFEILAMQPVSMGFCVLVKQQGSDVPTPPNVAAPLSRLAGGGGAAPGQQAPKAAKDPAQAGATALASLVHKGHQLRFNTPNKMTAWRVQSLFEKEPDTIRWIESMDEGATLLDVGANVGMYSVLAAVTRRVRVHAFEPESQNYALLNANIAANNLSEQVVAYPLALSDVAKLDRLYLSDFSAGGSCHSFASQVGFDLKPRPSKFAQGSFSMSIDQLVESGAMPIPDYVKIDVDGFEHKVIEGARRTLSNPTVRSIIIELNTHLAEHRAAIETLQSLGFGYSETQATGALRKSGAFEGVGEFIFFREAASTVDFNRECRLAPPLSSRGRQVLQHVLDQAARAETIQEPFPYLVVDNVFPPDYYQEMLANFPDEACMRPLGESGRVARNMYQERLALLFTEEEFSRMKPSQQVFWREFTSWMYTDQFVNGFVHKFGRELEPRISKIVAAEGALRVKNDALLVNDQTNYAIGPHTDAPRRLVSFLFYLPADESMRDLGTSVYRHEDPNFVCWGGQHHPFEGFIRTRTVEFLPNRLLAFPKTERAFHGVERIERQNVSRRLLINNIRLLNNVTH